MNMQGDIWNQDHRQEVAHELCRLHRSADITVSAEQGYVLLPKGAVDHFDGFQARVRKLFHERLREDGSMVPVVMDGGKKKPPKPYMQSVLCGDDFPRYPELFALGLNPRVLAAVSSYFGTLPVLRTVEVYWTPPSKGPDLEGSQFFHFDHDNYRELKMFFYIDDMDEEGGPFTFLPKPLSEIVARQAKPLKGKRYSDEEVFRVCHPQDAIKFTGPAGACAFVDTSNCLHFGGRVDHRGRLLVQHHFLRPDSNVIAYGRINFGAIAGLELDDIGRMVVAVPPWAGLDKSQLQASMS